MGERVAIAGIGQTYHTSRRPDINMGELINEAATAALEDAQLSIKDVDAVLMGNMDAFEGHNLVDAMVADYSGALFKTGLKINTGGTVGGSTVMAGWHYAASGLFDTVLVIGWEKLDECESAQSAMITAYDAVVDRPFCTGVLGVLATFAQRYMSESGCKEEHAAMVRVKAANNALKNPHAHLNKMHLTVPDVLNSPVVVYPLRLLHICPTTVGACAMILAPEKRGRKITKKPVWIKDAITIRMEYYSYLGAITYPPIESTMQVAARKLYGRNGITNVRRDVDMFEIYDPCVWCELAWMEDFHVCEKGEAWKLVEKGMTELDGEFPVNPSGGVVSNNPIGASSMIRPAEAALQIRGDAGEHQVTRKVNTALASGFGATNCTELFLLSKTP